MGIVWESVGACPAWRALKVTCSHPTLVWPHTCVQIPENEAVIWIDFYCVNQHRPVAAPEMSSIADVMKGAGKVRLVSRAGRRQGVAAISGTAQLGRQKRAA